MFSTDAIMAISKLLDATKDARGKAWLEEVREATGLSPERFGAAVVELGAAVVLSRDDMTQRPDAEMIGDCQRIELAPERAEVE